MSRVAGEESKTMRNSMRVSLFMGLVACATQAAPSLDTIIARLTARLSPIETYDAHVRVKECSG
jgi:outer membrane lipoprotein-sorting protein